MSMVTRSLCVRYTPDRPVFCSSCSCSVAQLWVRQAPLSMGFSRKEYLCGLPLPPLGDLPDPKISPTSTVSSSLLHCRWILYHWATGKAQINLRMREYMWVQMKQERLWTDEWLYVSNVYVRTYWTLSHVFLDCLKLSTVKRKEREEETETERNKNLSFKSFVIRQMTQSIQDCSKKSDVRMLDLSKINLGITSSILQQY